MRKQEKLERLTGLIKKEFPNLNHDRLKHVVNKSLTEINRIQHDERYGKRKNESFAERAEHCGRRAEYWKQKQEKWARKALEELDS